MKNIMNRNVFILIFIFPVTAFSQHFNKAPKSEKPVHKIIEWITYGLGENETKETVKGYEYEFRRDGLPLLFYDHWNEKQASYEYDSKGRVVKITKDAKGNPLQSGVGTIKYYPYKKIATLKTEDGAEMQSIKYLNQKGLEVEEKRYVKMEFTDYEKVLSERLIFNYDDKDSLFGIMNYHYDVTEGTLDGKSKTLHYFQPGIHRKILSQHYNQFGNLRKKVEYLYDEEGRIAIIDTNAQTDNWERIEFRYKEGELWQKIDNNFLIKEKEVMVYKNGLPIRYKEYFRGKLFRYTDFQYIYY